MTDPIDLEALRAALGVMDDAAYYLPDAGMVGLARRLTAARAALANGITELTTRRARDAEVEALVAAARNFFYAQCNLDNREAMGPNADDHDTLMRRRNAARRELDDVLVTFTGATP